MKNSTQTETEFLRYWRTVPSLRISEAAMNFDLGARASQSDDGDFARGWKEGHEDAKGRADVEFAGRFRALCNEIRNLPVIHGRSDNASIVYFVRQSKVLDLLDVVIHEISERNAPPMFRPSDESSSPKRRFLYKVWGKPRIGGIPEVMCADASEDDALEMVRRCHAENSAYISYQVVKYSAP